MSFILARGVPFAIMLVVLGVELSPVHGLVTGPALTATPALAALTMGPRGTLCTAALALVVDVTTATYNQAWGSALVFGNLFGLLLVSAASVMLSQAMSARRQGELDAVRRIAVAAQDVVLRPVPARLGPLRAASLSVAAETEARIGGDLYEAVQTRYGIRMIVGDVRGKGLSAVRAVAAVLGAFREAVHYEDDLREVMDHCAAALRREAARPGAYTQDALMEGFTTALVAQVSDRPEVRLVNRGHPPPLILRQNRVRTLEPTRPLPPLGLENLVTDQPGKPDSYAFVPGDRLLFYTDGVVEARNRANEFFGLPQAMEGMDAGVPPEEFLERLHRGLIRHTGDHLADDVAMILVDRLDGEVDHGAAGG